MMFLRFLEKRINLFYYFLVAGLLLLTACGNDTNNTASLEGSQIEPQVVTFSWRDSDVDKFKSKKIQPLSSMKVTKIILITLH